MSATAIYTVSGMTCGHCVSSVQEEIAELPGVENVDVVLDSGQVTITSQRALPREDVEQAVREAGYQLL